MKEFFYSRDKEKVREFLTSTYHGTSDVDDDVAKIIADVRDRGDEAVVEYTKTFDGVDLSEAGIRMSEEEIKKCYDNSDKKLIKSLRVAAERIETFHARQVRENWELREEAGIVLSQKYIPLARVGVYVPGWKAAYPSSVLMNVIPAKVAGVSEIIMTSPFSKKGEINEAAFAAAHICGIKEVYKIGGAQAIAALAFGTETVPKVDKVVGPGNKYVAAAKRLLYGVIDIDMIAGPSEIMILADSSTPIEFMAADLLSQAEHDEDACAILVHIGSCDTVELKRELGAQAAVSPRLPIIRKSLKRNGAIIIVDTVDEAIDLANLKAPEHLQMMFTNAEAEVSKVRNAGAIFVGQYTPEPIGDYIAGPNHVLPTGGTARFFSPLSVDDFVKKTHVVQFSKAALDKLSTDTIRIAEKEGLFAHANSIRIRE